MTRGTDLPLPATIHMRLIAPERDLLRVYSIREQLSLFGPPELLIEWGAMGWKRLRLRVERFGTLTELNKRKAKLYARRCRHGYLVVPSVRNGNQRETG